MTARVFIDGDVGTTGLQIKERLGQRGDIELIEIPAELRKDATEKARCLNAADFVILCLPDDAARESVSLIENDQVRVIDASSAHRVVEGWTYGFPEYEPEQYDLIRSSSRVTNPGCYAITSVAILHPLVSAGLVPADWPVTINAISGYSGGGRKLIERFEDDASPAHTDAAYFVYGLGLKHKHLPEITKWAGLARPPVFVPSVGRYAQGMIVQVPLALWALDGQVTAEQLHETLRAHYDGCRFVTVPEPGDIAAIGELDPEALNGTNELRLHVFASEDGSQAVVIGLLDNLAKGASGQAVQNLNIMMGVAEETGLDAAA